MKCESVNSTYFYTASYTKGKYCTKVSAWEASHVGFAVDGNYDTIHEKELVRQWLAEVHAKKLAVGACWIPGPVRRMWQSVNELHWQWPLLGRIATEDGATVDLFRHSRKWIGHLLRQAQRRLILRRVPRTRQDAGDVADYTCGVDFEDTCGLLRARGRKVLGDCGRGFLANALTGGRAHAATDAPSWLLVP